MPWQIGTSFTSYQATATTWQSDAAPSWLPLIDDHPLIRTHRSIGTAQHTITCTFGSLVTLGGFLLQNTNAGIIALSRSTDGTSYVDLTSGEGALSPRAIGQHYQYRRYCLALAVQATHVRVTIPTQTPLDGASHFEIGSILFPAFTAWPRSPRPGLRESITRDYERSGNSIAKAGPLRVEQEFSLMLQAGLEPAIKTFAMLGEDEAFAVFEDNGNNAEALLMRQEGAINFERHRLHRVITGLKFRELC